MSKPRIYRSHRGRWYVQVPWLFYSVGPFPDWACAYRYATTPLEDRNVTQ